MNLNSLSVKDNVTQIKKKKVKIPEVILYWEKYITLGSEFYVTFDSMDWR